MSEHLGNYHRHVIYGGILLIKLIQFIIDAIDDQVKYDFCLVAMKPNSISELA